jgi:hypothetical protein
MASEAGHPRWATGLALCLLLVLLAAAGCGGEEIAPPRPPGDASDARAAGAATTLRALQRGLTDRDRSAVLALAAPDAASRTAVTALYDNAVALDLRDIGFRYVDTDETPLPGRVSSYGAKAWGASVTATWRIDGYDRGDAGLTTRFGFVATADGERVASVGGGDDRGAIWLTGPLSVEKSPDTLVMVAGGSAGAGRFEGLAKQAVLDVRKVLRSWHGSLVVEVPGSEAQLESVLGARKGEYAAIAAVTTTVDGDLTPGSPVHVFVNPGVFDGLGPQGSQVVLSHETTHVATKATFASMPTWLLEGFADFVALAHSDVPLRTAAAQVIARVRTKGAPDHLPTAADLDPSAPGLGATYEEVWTVCRFLGATYGEQKMVSFYDAVEGGASTQEAFRTVLGTTQPSFVKRWRTDLVAIAGGQGGA